MSVPRIHEVVEQLSQANTTESLDESGPQHLLAYKQTTLRPYVEFFERFVNQLAESVAEGLSGTGGNLNSTVTAHAESALTVA